MFPILTSQTYKNTVLNSLQKNIVVFSQLSSSVQHRSSTSSATSFKSMPFSSDKETKKEHGKIVMLFWLVDSTPLKNISQFGFLDHFPR